MNSKLFYLSLIVFSFSMSSFAQEITMFPGFLGTEYYQDTDEISAKEVGMLMEGDKEVKPLWQKSKSHMIIAYIATGVEFGFLLWYLKRVRDGGNLTAPLIGTIGSASVAIGYIFSSANLKKKAILKYNQNQDVGGILNLGATYNGLGLVYQF